MKKANQQKSQKRHPVQLFLGTQDRDEKTVERRNLGSKRQLSNWKLDHPVLLERRVCLRSGVRKILDDRRKIGSVREEIQEIEDVRRKQQTKTRRKRRERERVGEGEDDTNVFTVFRKIPIYRIIESCPVPCWTRGQGWSEAIPCLLTRRNGYGQRNKRKQDWRGHLGFARESRVGYLRSPPRRDFGGSHRSFRGESKVCHGDHRSVVRRGDRRGVGERTLHCVYRREAFKRRGKLHQSKALGSSLVQQKPLRLRCGQGRSTCDNSQVVQPEELRMLLFEALGPPGIERVQRNVSFEREKEKDTTFKNFGRWKAKTHESE